jgi:hypothetical protein
MNIEAIKLELVNLLINTTNEEILLKIKRIYQEEMDWWDEMSMEEKQELKEAIVEDEKGDYINHEDVMKHFDKWK